MAEINLKSLREQNNPENDIKIQELERNLEELRTQKEAILSETRESLSGLPEESIEYIPTDDEKERTEAIQISKNISSIEDLLNTDFIQDLLNNIETPILAMLAKTLKFIF